MLWNNIYQFFVEHVFGGWWYEYVGNEVVYRGYNAIFSVTSYEYYNTANNYVSTDFFGVPITIGNYLSLIATLISISVILVLCCLFVYKIIKLIGGLIR